MAIAKSKIVDVVTDILASSDALTNDEVDELARDVADKMVGRFVDCYDDDEDEKVTTGYERDDV